MPKSKSTVFAKDVLLGLQQKNKVLPSKYLYDKQGDEFFQQIMRLDEYYLTRKELEIFETQKADILNSIYDGEPFRIIELGAGDGMKTKILLRFFLERGVPFTYTPIDISSNVLKILEENLNREMPDLKIESFVGDYFEILSEISKKPEKDVLFFLGSNIGNFLQLEAENFLTKLHQFLNKGDLLLMGVDLKKDSSIILPAYNDKKGITKKFTLNLLNRINNELGGNFDQNEFLHSPSYNPSTGECRNYLMSKKEQKICIGDEQISFKKGEKIFMEVSKKYNQSQLERLATTTGFTFKKLFFDANHWFADVLWEK